MSGRTKRYRAFISYSQKDKVHARRLHQALENYRLPGGVDAEGVDAKTRKLGRFFRDDEEMGAATDLGAALKGALADAESLIVVCSPHAARSRWVNEEIIHFKRTGRSDRIFAVIVGGEPNKAAADQDRECFPPALRFELGRDGALTDQPAEPLGLDMRKEPFNRLLARLTAGLVRAPFDALWKREQRRARARAASLSLVATLIILIVGGAATQNFWRPKLDAYLRYTRFAHATDQLGALEPGMIFQDCRPGSTDCPLMVIVPDGRFLMGSPADNSVSFVRPDSPQREIAIARFAVSQTEITFANWNACVTGGGCNGYEPDRAGWLGDSRPVINVSWEDAQRYVSWLSQMTGHEYRLLTEAEWEYAARARTTPDGPQTRFSWGDEDPVCEISADNGAAFLACEQGATWEVGSFRANAFGLHDMHGNVLEWVEDCYAPYNAEQRNGAAIRSDTGATEESGCLNRVYRGGAWMHYPLHLASAYRDWNVPSNLYFNLGFRVARTL